MLVVPDEVDVVDDDGGGEPNGHGFRGDCYEARREILGRPADVVNVTWRLHRTDHPAAPAIMAAASMIPGKANVSALAGHAVSRIGVLFAVTYLAIQLVVPFFGLTTARQYRFAWKMFVPDDAPPPRFLVVFRDGSIQDLADLNRQRPTAVVRRPEVDRLRFVPPHLCRAVRAAEAVIVEVGDRQRRHRCP